MLLFWSCKTVNASKVVVKEEISVGINLSQIIDDRVLVTIKTPKIKSEEITYFLPKTVPGTYSEDNYGRYIDDLKAYNAKGELLNVKKTDQNSWVISKANTLDKITYYVNDTYDLETGKGFGSDEIFSPSGSNIISGKNIMLNTHCFVGYFSNCMAVPYRLSINHPEGIWGATSLTDHDNSNTNDLFLANRYADLIENPIMYSKPDYTTFKVDDMDIVIAVYSPTGKITAESITPEMKTMMTAQKKFLGAINTTNKYTVLLYLSTMKQDAQGFGALEHPTATTVVFPEMISKEELDKMMKDVVSHEFFHIVTPLTVHSQEIQNFDFNNPKMSEHLWMYEGITEYFANLFQINQGLITEEAFYSRMAEKINNARKLDDTMPFTTMSKNVLVEPYKSQYLNVYEKGALIAMCMDILIREKSNGKRGVLDLMQKLSKEYGVNKAFNDEELFAKITELTYPEVKEFLDKYVSGPTPIPYDEYFAKVGVQKTIKNKPTNVFLKGQIPYLTVDQSTKEIIVLPNNDLNVFFHSLQLKGGDIILSFNEKNYNFDNIYEMLADSEKWKENEVLSVKIKRNGKEQLIKGSIQLPYEEFQSFEVKDATKSRLKNAWLKN